MSEGPFSQRTLLVVAVLGSVSLLAGFAAVIFGPELREVHSSGTDSFSTSALGHRAFVELLRRSGRDVIVNRRRAADELGGEPLLVLIEPTDQGGFDDEDAARLKRVMESASRVLLVLPKRHGHEDPEHPGWVRYVSLVSTALPKRVLAAIDVEANVRRGADTDGEWSLPGDAPAPTLDEPQLLRSAEIVPRVRRGTEILVGRLPGAFGPEHYVLSDPDLIATHGLGRGQNAALALAILDEIAPADTPIVVDETLHGLAADPNVWSELGRFPLVLVVIQGALVAAFLLWSGMRRFGAPAPAREGLGAGKRVLIDNTAELLLGGGYSASVLWRYLHYNERRVADAYHLPPDLARKDRRARLADIQARGGGEISVEGIEKSVRRAGEAEAAREQRMLRAAQDVQRWRKEMLHGAR